MESNAERKYRPSRKSSERGGGDLIPRNALWAALAHDDDAYNDYKQQAWFYLLVGLNDLRRVDDDLAALSKSEKVKIPNLDAIKAASAGRSRLGLEDRLFFTLPEYLIRVPAGVRQAEQFQVVYDLAVKHGYLDVQGIPTSKFSAWRALAEGSDKQVQELLAAIQCRYRSEEFRQLIDHRENLASRHLEEQWSLASTLLDQHGRVHAMVIDLGVHKSPMPFGVMSSGYQPAGQRLMEFACQLMGYMQSDGSVREQCLGAVVHVERHQDHGLYLRVIFLLLPGELGLRRQFHARLIRLWQGVVGHGGWMQDRHGHRNKIVGGLGVVSVKDETSLVRLKKALYYLAWKDLQMQVDVGNGSTFLTAAIRPIHYGGSLGSLPAYRA